MIKPFVVKEAVPDVDLSANYKRIGPETSEEDEAYIIRTADQFSAFRFRGRGTYDRLGPFPSLEVCLAAIRDHCQADPQDRGFMVYASKQEGSRHAHVLNTDKFGTREESLYEWKIRREDGKRGNRCHHRR